MKKYVVIDLEMCRVPRNKKTKEYPWKQETIQIGAVLMYEDGTIIDTFNTFVRPQLGSVDSFIEKLTGIREKDVLKAPSTEEAFDAFLKWAPPDTEIVSWSESDLFQIIYEFKGKSINLIDEDALRARWIDCQRNFSEKIGNAIIHNGRYIC